VRLLAPLADSLAEIQDGLVVPREDDGIWRDHDFRNWRKRYWRPACEAAGLSGLRPYDLRHSFASLMLPPADQAKPLLTRPFSEALCRTRTDDPFLTMEVLYQLS
jgi:hypothetical protein